MRKNDVVRHTSPFAVALILALAGGCGSSGGGWPAAGAAMVVPQPVPASRFADNVAAGAVGFPQYPSLSPDGAFLIYAWAGDLWAVPTKGGVSSHLTAHPADDRRSAFSPDGRWLAFDSTRDGGRNLYVAAVSQNEGVVSIGQPVRITTADQVHNLGGWTADGKGLLFSAAREPAMYRSARMYRVAVRTEGDQVVGGGVIEPLTEAFGQLPRAAADGSGIVFTRNNAGLERPKYRGSGNTDVYRMNADGSFARLTEFDGTDAEGTPLPDGSVVFISSRDGQNNVWRQARGQNAPVQLTRFAPKSGEATIAHGVRDLTVSADGKTAAFCVWDTLYTLDLAAGGAEPKAIALRSGADSVVPDTVRMNLDRELTEQAISPDGKTVAMVARGEVFVRSTQEGFPTRRVTMTSGRERGLAWSPDGKVLYFASDDAGPARTGEAREGVYSLYKASVELAREDISPDKDKKAKEEKPKEEKAKEEKKPEAAPAEAAGESKSVEAAAEASKEKKEEPKKAEKKPDFGKRWSEALRFKVEQVLTLGGTDARNPNPSPDGTKLMFTRGRGDLIMVDLASSTQTELLSSWDEPDAIWAGDSRHVIYAVSDLDFNSDIWLLDTGSPRGVASDGGKRRWANPVNLTQHPDNDLSPRLSADGKVLAFLSERAAENDELDVWVVNLDRAIDSMSGYERDEYFKKAAEAAGKRKPLGASGDKPEGDKKSGDEKKGEEKKPEDKKSEDKKPEADKPGEPMEFDAEDAYLRVRRLVSMPGAETSLAMTPGGDRVIFVGSGEPERSLMSVDFKGGDKKVLQAGAVGDVRATLTGDKVSFVRMGQGYSTNPKAGGKVDGYPIDAPVVVNIPAQQRQKFLEASRALGEGFYHPTLKGLDWPALTERYLSLITRTRTNDEFNRITQMLFGELDGSHTGISGGASFFPAAPSPAVGYLGVRTTPVAGGYRVDAVTIGSPADAKGVRLEKGDVLVAVDGVRFAADDTSLPVIEMEAAMAGKAGKETLVEVRRAAGPGTDGAAAKPSMFLTTPIGYTTWVDLGYWDEVGRRREAVEKLSGGKIGYLHIRAMGEAAVRDFERDLYAAAHGKDGLIIDVRDNGGGSTADILLSSLTAPSHAYTIPRGADPKAVPKDSYPRDRRLIYGYSRPIVVLINQNAFSNAEIFAHAIKTIKRGKLVGTATFGGVISTGAISLIDGTTVRMPFRGWYLPDGTDQENHGAQPDIDVPQTPEDEAAGRDRQLEAAVKELMK